MAPVPPSRGDSDLRQYFQIFKRQKWVILAVVTACVLASLAFSFTQPKVFEARSNVLLDGGKGTSVLYSGDIPPTVEQSTGTEIRVMNGTRTQQEVEAELGYLPDVEFEVTEKVALVTVVGKADSAAEAAKLANDFTTAYRTVRTAQIQEELSTALEGIRATATNLDQDLAETKLEADRVEAAMEREADPTKKLQMQFELERLREKYSSGAVATRLQDLQAQEAQLISALALNESGAVTITGATEPEAPVSPRPGLNAIIALATGLLLGVALAFARDYFDDSIRTKEELDELSGGRTVLSLVPKVEGWKQREQAVLEAVAHPHGAAAEAYRSLRTALDFAALDHKISIVQITSSNAGEGKTTTATNLAVSVARADRRVILVDGDLRKPRLHEFFELDNERGFTSVLLGECTLGEALQRPDDIPNLMVLTSGPPPPNPSELLSTKAAEELLSALTQPTDLVIVDSPPLLPVADATILARYVDSTVLVVCSNSTSKRSLNRSLEILDQADAPLEGLVLNDVEEKEMYAGTYGYGYGGEA